MMRQSTFVVVMVVSAIHLISAIMRNDANQVYWTFMAVAALFMLTMLEE